MNRLARPRHSAVRRTSLALVVSLAAGAMAGIEATAGTAEASSTSASWALRHPGIATTGVPMGQTFGGDSYAVNPTAVDEDVNSGDGALEVAHEDLIVAGIGVPLDLKRQYNSRNTGETGAFGPGWSSLLDLAVTFTDKGQQATVHGEDGQEVTFAWQSASHSWAGAPGARSSLSCSGPATGGVAPASCTVTRYSDGVHWTLSHGHVQNYLTAAGQGLRFRYSGNRISAVLVETTAKTPLVVAISRSSSGRITKISTPTRHVTYGYDSAGDLTTVTDAAGRVWRMTYDGHHHLTSMASYPSATSKTAASKVVATYDATTGRVASCTSQDGASRFDATFGWTPTAGEPTTGTATRNDLLLANGLTNRRWTSTDQYSNGVLVQRVDANGDAEDLSWNGNLDLTSTVNPVGGTDVMTYDKYGDETSSDTELAAGQDSRATMSYDSAHRLVSSTDGDGLVTKFTYTKGGELASETKPGSATTTLTYGTDGLIATETDPLGNVTTYHHDAAGNVTNTSITTRSGAHPVGNGPVFAYDEAGNETQSVPAIGDLGGGRIVTADRTTYTYDADGELLRTVAPGNATTSATYDAAGNITSKTNAMGKTTTYTFSADSSTTQPGAEKEVIASPAGTTTNVFDANGDLLSSTPPADTAAHAAASMTTYSYDAAGDVLSETDARGNVTTFTRDALGNVLTSSSMGDERVNTYNLVGWTTSTTTQSTVYPADNGTLATPQNTPSTTSQQYDADGNVVEATDATGGTTKYSWVDGHLEGVVTGDGLTSYVYDANGNVTRVQTQGGLFTNYAYDALGHVTSKSVSSPTSTATETWKATYDVDGDLASTTDPDGRTATYGFNLAGQETAVKFGWKTGTSGLSAPSVSWTYNAAGERTEMVDGSGTHHYTYDGQGRLTSVSTVPKSGTAQTFTYSYKAAQVLTTYPDGTKVTDKMDDGGNLLSVSVPALADGTPAYTMTNMLPVDGTTDQHSTGTVLSSSDAAMPSTGTVTNSDPTTLPPTGTAYSDGTLGYTFNTPMTASLSAGADSEAGGLAAGTAFYTNGSGTNGGNPTYYDETVSDTNGYVLEEKISGASSKLLYGYNGGGAGYPVAPTTSPAGSTANSGVRLTSVQDQLGQLGTYTYGSNGTLAENSVTTINSGTPSVISYFNYNGLDQVTSEGSSLPQYPNTWNWSYDKAGQATSAFSVLTHQSIDDGGAIWKLSYNAAGQMAKAVCSAQSVTVTYAYDGDGNLVSEKATSPSASMSVAMQYDSRPATPQLALADITDGTTTTHQRYLWGDGPLAVEENGTYFTFHTDDRGTPISIVGADGNPDEYLLYDPYGNLKTPAIGSGPTASAVDTASAPILVGFDSSFRDPITGLDDFGARWYDPVADQYLSPSPVLAPTTGASVESPYQFAGDDPLNTVDAGGVHAESMSAATSFLGTPGAGALDNNGAAPPGDGPPQAPAPVLTPMSGLTKPTSPQFTQQLQTTVASAWGQARAYVTAPKTVTQQSINLAKKVYTWLQSTEEQPGTMNAEVGVEERTVGAGAEDAVGADEGGVLEGSPDGSAENALEDGGGDLFSGAAFGAGLGFQLDQTAQTCGEYGSESSECIGAAITVTVSTVAFVACDALTGGTGSVFCSGLQSIINLVLPVVVQYVAPVFSLVAQTVSDAGDFLVDGLANGSLVEDTVEALNATFGIGFIGDVFSSWFSGFGPVQPRVQPHDASTLMPIFDGYGSSLCDVSPQLACLFPGP